MGVSYMKMSLSFFAFLTVLVMPVLSGAQEYSGMIINDIGRPAAFAKVILENMADASKTMSVVTDTTGTFKFELSQPAALSEKTIPFKLFGNFPNPFNPLDIPYIARATELKLGQGDPRSIEIAGMPDIANERWNFKVGYNLGTGTGMFLWR